MYLETCIQSYVELFQAKRVVEQLKSEPESIRIFFKCVLVSLVAGMTHRSSSTYFFGFIKSFRSGTQDHH